MIRPSEISLIWNSANPKQDLIAIINRFVDFWKN